MSNISFQDHRFIFSGEDGERVLLDCSDLLANKSRISMHRLPEDNILTIPELLLDLFERQNQEDAELVFPTLLLDTLLASRLIRTRNAVNVLEYGSLDGRLSWHWAEVLGTFHPESAFVCAYDAIEPEWLQQIERAKYLPGMSYLAGDFGKLPLREKYFDIVLVNGRVNYYEPAAVLKDAGRLLKDGGVLMCYCDSTPLLESTFKLFFESREEFEITPSSKVLVTERGIS